jgi:hypothetical protein
MYFATIFAFPFDHLVTMNRATLKRFYLEQGTSNYHSLLSKRSLSCIPFWPLSEWGKSPAAEWIARILHHSFSDSGRGTKQGLVNEQVVWRDWG